MKLPRFLLPALGAISLLASPATSLADHHKITVYRDRDGDGHFNKKTFDFHNSHSSHGHYYGSGYPYGYRGYGSGGYGYAPYGYGSYYGGPSVSFSVNRSYSPGYSSDYSGGYADDLAVDVQRELRRRGYYRGTIDGDIGPGTRNAIRAYQYDRGLSASGRIDRSLLRSLGIG